MAKNRMLWMAVCALFAAAFVVLVWQRDSIRASPGFPGILGLFGKGIDRMSAKPQGSGGAVSKPALITLPFVGEVAVREEKTELRGIKGTASAMPFKVFRTEGGQFVAAEYLKSGSISDAASVEDAQVGMRVVSERITGLPNVPAPVSWERALDAASQQVDLKGVTEISVWYVTYEMFGSPAAPMYIVNIYGAEMWPDSRTTRKAVRLLINSEGEALRWDDRI